MPLLRVNSPATTFVTRPRTLALGGSLSVASTERPMNPSDIMATWSQLRAMAVGREAREDVVSLIKDVTSNRSCQDILSLGQAALSLF